MKTSHNPFWLALLGIPAFLYGAAARTRLFLYGRAGLVRHAGLPVLSVGNLTVGGTGKTTMVAWLARRLREKGRRPAVVTRGYKGLAGRGPLFVSRGDGPLVGPRAAGDEPYLLARDLPGVMILAGSDRLRGAGAARKAGADVVILDDGFQHVRLARDLDLLLLDAHSPFGNYRLLPAGILREPTRGLERADLLMITRSRPGESFVVLERVVRRYSPSVPILRAGHRRVGFVDSRGNPVPRPESAVAFCGIGNPDAFLADLHAEGIHLVAFRAFRDHHAFTHSDRAALRDLAASHGAALLTTEKDMVRLPESSPLGKPPLYALRIEAVVHDAKLLMDHVDAALSRRGPKP